MRRIKKRDVLRTKISIYISFEVLDKLEELSEKYEISRSQVVEKCVLAVYNVLKEKEKENQPPVTKEVTVEAR